MPYITLCYERAKLYAEVWAEPVTKVAKSYGVSDVASEDLQEARSAHAAAWLLDEISCGKKASNPAAPQAFRPDRDRQAALRQ